MNEKGNKEAGKSSFSKVDTNKFYQLINIQPGESILDLGCGRGEYLLEAGKYTGDTGQLYAMDDWEDGIKILKEQAESAGVKNLMGFAGNMLHGIPIEEGILDKCLMIAVFHNFQDIETQQQIIQEVKRVLKRQGEFILIEWKKIEGPPGPSIKSRFSPEDMETLLNSYGFRCKAVQDLGEFFYGIVFENN